MKKKFTTKLTDFFYFFYFHREGTVSNRKFILAVIGVFGSNMGQMQVMLTLMLVMIVIVITATVQPFSDLSGQQQTLQNLEMASLMSIFLTLWAASVFKTYPKCEDPLQGEGKTLLWCEFLSLVVGLTNFVTLFTLVAYFVSIKFFGKSFISIFMNRTSVQEEKEEEEDAEENEEEDEVEKVEESEVSTGIEMSSLTWQPQNPCYQDNKNITSKEKNVILVDSQIEIHVP